MTNVLRLNSTQLKKHNYYADTDKTCPFCKQGSWADTGRTMYKESECGHVAWIDNSYQVIPQVKLTLVIEDATCERQLGDYGLSRCRTYFDMLDYAYASLKKDYETVIVYKNCGSLAGGSVAHAHTQIAAANKVAFRVPEWSYEGRAVHTSENLTVNVATEGAGETYEINFMNHGEEWGDATLIALEVTIKYIQEVYGAGFSYNLLVDNGTHRMKLVCRTHPVTTFYYYDVRLYPPLEAIESFAEKLEDRLLTILNE